MPRLLSLCLITALALVTAACGANPTPSEDVADAGAKTKAAGTARVEMVSRLSGSSAGLAGEFRTTGVVDYVNDRSEYRDESTGCRSITIGDVSFSEYALLEDGLPAGKRWVRWQNQAVDSEALYEESQEQTSDDGAEIRIHFYGVVGVASPEPAPYEYLDNLREISGEPERVGEEDVRGVPTTRYHATIDVLSSMRKELEAQGWKAVNVDRYIEDVEGGVREIDVWVDSDGRVRRIVTAESSKGGGEAIAIEWQTTTEFFDFGFEAGIQPPPAAEVMESVDWQRISEKHMKEELDEYVDEIEERNTPLPGAFEPELSQGGGSGEPASCLH